jgi:hypothetical protein
MANIVIFHSVLGLRKGIIEAAQMLRDRRFQEIGITEMMSRTMSSIKDFPDYDRKSTELLWQRVMRFLQKIK